VCVLPVGSLEQHGEHLPVGTDSLLVETICLRAAGLARADAIVAPTLWTGLSPHHVRLGVTVTLDPELLIELTRQIVRCLRPWFRRVVLVNGHGGNRGWLGALALVEECPHVNYWELVEPALLRELFPVDLGSIGHAGQAETSAMLTVAPELVGETDGARFEPIRRENDAFRLPDMGATGVLGDPSTASAEAGERFIGVAVEGLARLLDSLPPPTAKEA
jgi:creatinine amidohydrolase